MAVDFKDPSFKRTSEYSCDPSALKINPKLNGRHDLPDIEWLIQDIAANGQLEPVIIRSDGGDAVLCAGFSRWRAIVEINKRDLPCGQLKIKCSYFKGNERDGFEVAIRENRFRNATSALDDAYNIAQLQRWGRSDEDIATLYREDVAWVKNRLKLVELAPEAQEALRSGKLKAPAAVKLAKLSTAEQRKAVSDAGEGKVRVPQAKTSGQPKETVAAAKAIARHKALTEIEKLLAELEVWNAASREKVLRTIRDLAAKCAVKE